jgi:hypothetical protein
MGYHFKEMSGIDPFCIDQSQTVKFPSTYPKREEIRLKHVETLGEYETMAFLKDEAPIGSWGNLGSDAFIFSKHNELE